MVLDRVGGTHAVLNVLISAAGRRVRLVQLFRDALRDTGTSGRVFASDVSPYAAALYAADEYFMTPRAGEAEHIPCLLRQCASRRIGLLVTVNDNELVPVAQARDEFAAVGTHVAMMGVGATRTSHDKRLTHAWLRERGFPVSRRFGPEETAALPVPFPVIVKPARGSAGLGVHAVSSSEELQAALATVEDPVIEELEMGQEFTVNVLASANGELVCAVPHLRLEVRAGEVSKGRTFRHDGLQEMARRLVTELPECRGPFNFQGFLRDDGDVSLTEINPRFGGGYPLAHAAGARFPEWLVREARGEAIPRGFDDWRSDVVMLRYDNEVLGLDTGTGRIEPL